MSKTRDLCAAVATGMLALAALATPCAGRDDDISPFAGDAAAAKEGRALFLRSGCVPCHGPNAEGAIGPSLIDDQWIFQPTPGALFRTISNGRRGTRMVGFSDRLKPEEIWKIVEYLLTYVRKNKSDMGK